MENVYLGDGVYASYNSDAEGFVLTTGHHEKSKADQVIYLEHGVAKALIAFLTKHLSK